MNENREAAHPRCFLLSKPKPPVSSFMAKVLKKKSAREHLLSLVEIQHNEHPEQLPELIKFLLEKFAAEQGGSVSQHWEKHTGSVQITVRGHTFSGMIVIVGNKVSAHGRFFSSLSGIQKMRLESMLASAAQRALTSPLPEE